MGVVTVTGVTTPTARGVVRTVWNFATSLAPTTTSLGKPLDAVQYPDKTVSWQGPWVTGCTIVIEGSNTATYTTGTTAWFQMKDAGGTDLVYSTGKIKAVLENPRWIRPRLSARTGVLGAPVIIIVSQSTRR